MEELVIIGGGLAGSEAAWQAAQRGIRVTLFEMRPEVQTGAHTSPNLSELVCSNSFGSTLPDRAGGLLKQELHLLGSLLLECAEQTAVPAGGALAVDRQAFSELVTEKILKHPNIQVVRKEMKHIPNQPVIIASGPLTSHSLSIEIGKLTGREHLFFYDAIAPLVWRETIDMTAAFHASRFERGERQEGDYINCPFTRQEYEDFVDALQKAERVVLRPFDEVMEKGVKAGSAPFFEGCLPVEVLASRGKNTLAFGPMRPIGLTNPKTGKPPFAVVQLRQDNLSATLYNLVGFQTNLTIPEQKRIFRMIPGLEAAEFARYGQMHRNTFIFSPAFLLPSLQFKNRPDLFFAGQITGVEGYMGNVATGLLAGINAAHLLRGEALLTLPRTSMTGALCYYITHALEADFQPMKANFGILPPLEPISPRDKRLRAVAYRQRALSDLQNAYSLSTSMPPQ